MNLDYTKQNPNWSGDGFQPRNGNVTHRRSFKDQNGYDCTDECKYIWHLDSTSTGCESRNATCAVLCIFPGISRSPYLLCNKISFCTIDAGFSWHPELPQLNFKISNLLSKCCIVQWPECLSVYCQDYSALGKGGDTRISSHYSQESESALLPSRHYIKGTQLGHLFHSIKVGTTVWNPQSRSVNAFFLSCRVRGAS